MNHDPRTPYGNYSNSSQGWLPNQRNGPIDDEREALFREFMHFRDRNMMEQKKMESPYYRPSETQQLINQERSLIYKVFISPIVTTFDWAYRAGLFLIALLSLCFFFGMTMKILYPIYSFFV